MRSSYDPVLFIPSVREQRDHLGPAWFADLQIEGLMCEAGILPLDFEEARTPFGHLCGRLRGHVPLPLPYRVLVAAEPYDARDALVMVRVRLDPFEAVAEAECLFPHEAARDDTIHASIHGVTKQLGRRLVEALGEAGVDLSHEYLSKVY